MLFKLNSVPPPFTPGRCNVGDETSDNQSAVKIDGPGGKKEQVANYKQVLVNDFKVPEDRYFNAIPVNINHLKSFLEKNSPDMEASRIYITKRTSDSSKDDYELLFVPCTAIKDGAGQIQSFLDNLGTEGINAHIVSVECKRPPDCRTGALLLP